MRYNPDGSVEQPWQRSLRKKREKEVKRLLKSHTATAESLDQWISIVLVLFLLSLAYIFRAELSPHLVFLNDLFS